MVAIMDGHRQVVAPDNTRIWPAVDIFTAAGGALASRTTATTLVTVDTINAVGRGWIHANNGILRTLEFNGRK